MKILSDSEAPTYNFDSDDEAPCEYINDVYAISEDCFAFKIIKQLGKGYYNPGNGHRIKVIYYPLENEDNVTCVEAYLGKNDILPYICELAVKCMKEDEVCLIQAHKSFIKVFKNSEKKQKYDKREDFRIAFKKSLRFKQKCLDTYLSYPAVNNLKKIKINGTTVNILWHKKRITKKKEHEKDTKKIGREKENGLEKKEEEEQNFLTLNEIEELKYKFLKNEDLCTYVVYLKEFHRVDILNDDKTIIKEVIREGEGIVTPKKNDYVEFFVEEKRKKVYVHTIFDMDSLKYKGLFKILENMKKKEIAKVILKGEYCMHSSYFSKCSKNKETVKETVIKETLSDSFNKIDKDNKDKTNKWLDEVLYTQLVKDEQKEHLKFCSSYNIDTNGHIENAQKENKEKNTLKNIHHEKKVMIIELIDFKKSKITNITSIISKGKTEKLLFYINEKKNKSGNTFKPIIDNECELIIKISIKHPKNSKTKHIYLPINFYETKNTNTSAVHNVDISAVNSNNNVVKKTNNIRKTSAYFLLSFGSCFTVPIWFYDGLKNLKEDDEIIIPLCKNKNLFSENQFIHHLIFDELSGEEKENAIGKDGKCKQEDGTQWDDEHIVQKLMTERNKSKGFFLIENLEKKKLNLFCKCFFALQNNVVEKNKIKEILKNTVSFYKSLKKIKQIKKRKKKNTIKKGIIRKSKIGKNGILFKFVSNKENKEETYNIINQNADKRKHNKKKYIKKTNWKEQTKYDSAFFKQCLKQVYFDTTFHDKNLILKIKICKVLCKKKDPWNMKIDEQIENLLIYKERGNCFMKKNLIYAAFIQYKKGFDICRFSYIYKEIFEEKKTVNLNSQNEKTQIFLNQMEKILTNLSICSYKLEEYDDCILYADKTLMINSQNVKSIYWKNSAYLKQNKYSTALENLNNSFCLKNQALQKLYIDARIIKKKHDENFKSIFYAIYDKM